MQPRIIRTLQKLALFVLIVPLLVSCFGEPGSSDRQPPTSPPTVSSESFLSDDDEDDWDDEDEYDDEDDWDDEDEDDWDFSSVETATFLSVVVGDTIETSAGTVRLIGIDAPEHGECGHKEASASIGAYLERGDTVTLALPKDQNDRDKYGRLVRYVFTEDDDDLGLIQLEAGNAIARYDSTDGYPWHPFEDEYHEAQIATVGPNGSVITTSCQKKTAKPAKKSSDDRWWEQYRSCRQLKGNTVGHPTGPFDRDNPKEAEIYDWFANQTGNRGDGDGDGLACE